MLQPHNQHQHEQQLLHHYYRGASFGEALVDGLGIACAAWLVRRVHLDTQHKAQSKKHNRVSQNKRQRCTLPPTHCTALHRTEGWKVHSASSRRVFSSARALMTSARDWSLSRFHAGRLEDLRRPDLEIFGWKVHSASSASAASCCWLVMDWGGCE